MRLPAGGGGGELSGTERLGATPVEGGCAFLVWAPHAERVDVHVVAPAERVVRLEPGRHGYHGGVLEGVGAGACYRYRLDGDADGELADPASRFQPEGVHGPSQVVALDGFAWTDGGWRGLPLQDLALYELHVGTFTQAGTFDGAIGQLDALRELGVTAVEIMPVAQFPGSRNWGYDGVFPFAVQESYGGPDGLRRLVDACHARGLAVVLDVVYNHLGPEGNVLPRFGPYFTDAYRTPWGDAVNVDGPGSDEVRRYFLEHAMLFLDDYHVDALRLDAVHGIVDTSAVPFLAELAAAVRALEDRLGRRLRLIAESDLNDARLCSAPEIGGYGLDAQWSDDYHHALHVLLTGERSGYYAAFHGLPDLAAALRQGWVYAGQRSPARERRHGNSPARLHARQLVVYAQNHDQIGNRLRGDRLTALVDFEALKLAAGAVLLAPFVPLLFMGEEYGEPAPFPYFVSHSDPELVEAVRRGRREEFAAFGWQEEPPDPQAEETFASARLDHGRREQGRHAQLYALHRELLAARRELPALRHLSKDDLAVACDERSGVLALRRFHHADEALVLLNFGDAPAAPPGGAGDWRLVLDSADPRFGGPGADADRLAPTSFRLLHRERRHGDQI